MVAIVGRRRIERPGYAWLAVGLQIIIGLLAIPVGLQMISNPDGAPSGCRKPGSTRPRSVRG